MAADQSKMSDVRSLMMQTRAKVATCNLNQWALDFDGNLERIEQSIREAKKQGCKLRVGSELEISGYGCEDHFLEQDTFYHSWQSLSTLLQSDVTDDILVVIGMAVQHRSVSYNCNIWCLNRKILLIRPKMALANDRNYREPRWFTAWTRNSIEDFDIPRFVAEEINQRKTKFGAAIIRAWDTMLASETCEELFTPNSPHIALGLNGVEIFVNTSGSHHNLRKLDTRISLIREASDKGGGVYLYANQQGCDGGRLYYDGCAMIFVNGKMVAQGTQFSMNNIELVTATVDLSEVRSLRGRFASRGIQADSQKRFPIIRADMFLCETSQSPSNSISPRIHTPEEEIGLGPPMWLWDYLRRSGAGGFFLPLSGGADSSSTAAMVGIMCVQAFEQIQLGREDILAETRRITRQGDDWVPKSPQEICGFIMHTCYMGTTNSSKETRDRATKLSEEIGSYHIDANIDIMVTAVIKCFEMLTGKTPRFKVHGGTNAENLALQNIQARLRMVLSYMLAQLLPWVRNQNGFLLVLGSANVDEALRGYMTKYDCSSADINPIGGISKGDLKRFLTWAGEKYNWTALLDVVKAPPTAELEPITENYTQTDEADMGMTYEELGIYGSLRNLAKCGPVTMFQHLATTTWSHISPATVADKVKHFFKYYAINRHKLTVLTPSYHAENYSPDDNRFDHRQFLYPRWQRQFQTIDELVEVQKQANTSERNFEPAVVDRNDSDPKG